MKTVSLLTVCISGALLASFSPTQAAVLIQDDFESYTIGDNPTNPGDGNANNWVVNETAPANAGIVDIGDGTQGFTIARVDAADSSNALRRFDRKTAAASVFRLMFASTLSQPPTTTASSASSATARWVAGA